MGNREHTDKLKVLFLDVDGVLSCFGVRGLCSTRLDILADLVHETHAKIVLSSTWRHEPDQLERLEQELSKRGIHLFGCTPDLRSPVSETSSLIRGVPRGREIASWLTDTATLLPVGIFVILDDDPSNEMGDLQHALVKCDGYSGLTQDLAAEIVRRFNAQPDNEEITSTGAECEESYFLAFSDLLAAVNTYGNAEREFGELTSPVTEEDREKVRIAKVTLLQLINDALILGARNTQAP